MSDHYDVVIVGGGVAGLTAGLTSARAGRTTHVLTGAGLGGDSGWVILGYELDTGALRTVASAGHTQTQASTAPLLVMDMYEHSYQMDFGAAAAKYVDAFFANIQWDAVNARFERARSAHPPPCVGLLLRRSHDRADPGGARGVAVLPGRPRPYRERRARRCHPG